MRKSHKIKKDTVHLSLQIIGFICYLGLIILVSCSTASLTKNNKLSKLNAERIEVTIPIINKVHYPVEKDEAKTIDISHKAELKNSIAVIIDDCGVNEKNTSLISNTFPAEINMSFLPYSKEIQAQADLSKEKQHEVMLHLPMEALNYNEKGINTLRTAWSDEKVLNQTEKFMNSFKGYIGVNNHTGSKFTQDREKMDIVLSEIKKRNLFFLDSVTIASSVAYDEALKLKVPTNKRNFFLDHKDSQEYVAKQLERAEKFAKEKGLAIVIGHPKDNTITVLQKWIKTLGEKDLTLIPISKAIY